jgi:dTDP-4-amino-4,6-dideoxygalactose transaminase
MKRLEFNYTATSLVPPPATREPLFGTLEKDVRYLFSGKSVLALLLQWYRKTGALRDRSDELLVPRWLGAPVYAVIHPFCFPTTTMNERVRGVLVYHQWGFPQDMEALQGFCTAKKLFLIEDCAHAFDSYYKGTRVGMFGDAALFSLSKFFPSVVGGALYTRQAPLRAFAEERYADDDTALSKETFANCFAFDRRPTAHNNRDLLRNYAVYDRLTRCPAFSTAVARFEVAHGASKMRRHHYAAYQKAFAKSVPDVPPEEVAPWVVPFFASEGRCKKIVTALETAGVQSSVYHFDRNRNMLAPNFVPCVPLPCHQGMTEKDCERVITAVREAVC